MSLFLDGKVDRIALSGGRELSALPWHFVPIKMPEDIDLAKARTWVWHNLTGRFSVTTSETSGWHTMWVIGFEDPSEASAFAISMPLMVHDNEWNF